jgi:photosystem II stability/assembly factor-like uncharacterized protein
MVNKKHHKLIRRIKIMKYLFYTTFIASLLILTGLASESSAQTPSFEVNHLFDSAFEFPVGYDVELMVEVKGKYGDNVYVEFEKHSGKLNLVSGRPIESVSESKLRARPDSMGRVTVALTFTEVGETQLKISLRTSSTEYQTYTDTLKAVPLAAKWKNKSVSSSAQSESSKNYCVYFENTQKGSIVSDENILETFDGRDFNQGRPLASILQPGVSRERLRVYRVKNSHPWLYFLFGKNQNLLLRNEGSGWERVTIREEQQPDTQDVSIADMWFANYQNGIAVGPSGFLRTSDGGKTWTLQRLQPSFFRDTESATRHRPGHLTCLYFIDENTGWVAGSTGILFRMALNGPIFDQSDNTTFMRLYFTDSLRGWGINIDGALFRTEDGGQTWRAALDEPLANIALEDISFANDRYGCAVGGIATTAVILQTTDGGKSWTKIPFMSTSGFFAVQCISPNNIWAVGTKNSIYRFSFPYNDGERKQYE